MQSRHTVVIRGLGTAGLARSQPLDAIELAIRAIDDVLEDSGLPASEVDGLVISRSPVASDPAPGLALHRAAALPALRMLQVLDGEGTSAAQMIQAAAQAIAGGAVTNVICVFSDAPLRGGKRGSQAFGSTRVTRGIGGLRYSSGAFGAASFYAMAARRHMERFGTTREHLGAVAISTRRWACMNPRALFQDPLTMDTYLSARKVAEPFGLFDCAVPVDGAVAVLLGRAAPSSYRKPPVYVMGCAQAHEAAAWPHGPEDRLDSSAAQAFRAALDAARIAKDDVDMLQCYDAFTFMTLQALEDFGFCEPGESGGFVADGRTSPGGSLPVNTGGGHLSGFYLQGMTPIVEAVLQLRGDAGERQCQRSDIAVVTNIGGYFDHHAALVLGSAATI
jgi:acetyl-CoA acetyltransferase